MVFLLLQELQQSVVFGVNTYKTYDFSNKKIEETKPEPKVKKEVIKPKPKVKIDEKKRKTILVKNLPKVKTS